MWPTMRLSRCDAVMDALLRKPFEAQRDRVQAIARLLLDADEPAAVLNGEMGTGKTMMAIALAAIFHAEGHRRFLVLSPPHLAVRKRHAMVQVNPDDGPDDPKPKRVARSNAYAACPRCAAIACDSDGDPIPVAMFPDDRRHKCSSCGEPLWCLQYPRRRQKSRRELVADAMCQIPTIGPKTAEKLLDVFGEQQLEAMLADNVYEFINLMDDEGELVFSDRQATRMERALAKLEFSFGQGGYQASEFIKRYLPQGYFDLMLVDEGHEYKNDGSVSSAMAHHAAADD